MNKQRFAGPRRAGFAVRHRIESRLQSTMTFPASKPFLARWILPVLGRPTTYVLFGAGILLLDYATGPYLMFPILFVLPVVCAGWFYSARWAHGLAWGLPVGRLLIAYGLDSPAPLTYLAINASVRIAVLSLLAFLVARTARQTKELEREVKRLKGILPICMFCKRIRDDDASWQAVETYITLHSEVDFSHSVCPECQQQHYGEFFKTQPPP
jgi:hypothetical protein